MLQPARNMVCFLEWPCSKSRGNPGHGACGLPPGSRPPSHIWLCPRPRAQGTCPGCGPGPAHHIQAREGRPALGLHRCLHVMHGVAEYESHGAAGRFRKHLAKTVQLPVTETRVRRGRRGGCRECPGCILLPPTQGPPGALPSSQSWRAAQGACPDQTEQHPGPTSPPPGWYLHNQLINHSEAWRVTCSHISHVLQKEAKEFL